MAKLFSNNYLKENSLTRTLKLKLKTTKYNEFVCFKKELNLNSVA